MERKLAAILSADAAGYSRLMAEDELGTVRVLAACREAASEVIVRHGGRVVDMAGDNMLAEFPSAVSAVEAAAAMQAQLEACNGKLTENRRLEFRIGVNLGEVVIEEGRLYGDGVNVAARIEALAEPGGICVSAKVHDEVRRKLDLASIPPELPFKAGVHVNYQESVLPMRDGLPKMKDLPKEMGGSGATVPD